jgi:hypothetical protein
MRAGQYQEIETSALTHAARAHARGRGSRTRLGSATVLKNFHLEMRGSLSRCLRALSLRSQSIESFRSPRGWGLRVYVLVASLAGLALLVPALPQLDGAFAEMHNDLNVDLLTARAFLDHYSPFTEAGTLRSGLAAVGPGGHGHPPTTSFWFLPLGRMSLHAAGVVLGWVTILSLLIELAAILSVLHYPAPLVTAWLMSCFILSCSFMRYHLVVGQISGLIGFLYFAAWMYGRRGDDWLAGAALGIACTLKAFPGLMVVFFLLSCRWRVAAAAIGVYLVVAAYMTAGFGVSSWKLFLTQQGPIANLWMASIQNQSIHGIILRMFRPVCGPRGGLIREATLLSSLLAASLIAFGLWTVRRIVTLPAGFDVAYALFVVLSMVTSQWTWEHYSVIYVLPMLILAVALENTWRSRTHRSAVAAMFLILCAVISSWRVDVDTKAQLQAEVLGGASGRHFMLHVYDVLNWAPGLVLLAMLFVVCRWQDAAGARGHLQRQQMKSAGKPLVHRQVGNVALHRFQDHQVGLFRSWQGGLIAQSRRVREMEAPESFGERPSETGTE